ncbi:hypothetical protein COY07_03930 [Candidatus Peregrinibacteria bacterium CG_4_10_14_0_2_um_filter_43_11]|nr:MAG: hypothetical protein COY07_03930 [Candidatus Peregrinibacteria bacterium CG_4_10_14_0_2_um_filter_43_11]
MGYTDLMPISGGQKKKRIDPKRLKKLKEGGKRADAIHQKSEMQHVLTEVPMAEEELAEDLKKLS